MWTLCYEQGNVAWKKGLYKWKEILQKLTEENLQTRLTDRIMTSDAAWSEVNYDK